MEILSTILSTFVMLVIMAFFVAFVVISNATRRTGEAARDRTLQKVRNRLATTDSVTQRTEFH